MHHRRFSIVLMSFLIIFLSAANVFAVSEAEKTFLLMYFTEAELQVVSATRSLKSISRVAENIEVVTKQDIELMNAHTLADVLNTVNGVVVEFAPASPGGTAGISIQGSSIEHVLLMVDGVILNTASDWGDYSAVPARIIEKVEVIKGPASSVWGSSLGGIVNVITKAPRDSAAPGGSVSASYGSKNTADVSAELTGRKNGFGYYLSAGRLQTDGLRPVEKTDINDVYLKVNYDLMKNTSVTATFFYNQGKRELADFSSLDLYQTDKLKNLYGTLSLNTTVAEGANLVVSLRGARIQDDYGVTTLSTGEQSVTREVNSKLGASAKLDWKTGSHALVLGTDYDYRRVSTPTFIDSPRMNTYAVYANDTISAGRLTIIPGIRYDVTDRDFNFLSPSLGLTYDLADRTILRALVARGFHVPPLGANTNDGIWYRHNPDLKPESVVSIQAGLESGILEYAWAKASVFRHDIHDALVYQPLDQDAGTWTYINQDKVRRQGLELEIRSRKIFNLTFAAATTLVRATNLDTGERLHSWPDYTFDASLKYDDEKSLQALLKGRYVWWHEDASYNAKYSSFIVDANISKTIFREKARSCEIFLAVHNLFGGSSYWLDLYKNAGLWAEGGLRYKF